MSTWKKNQQNEGNSTVAYQDPVKKWVSVPVPYPRPPAYVICLEVPQVSDDANPDKKRRRPEQNAAQIVICEVLRQEEKIDVSKTFHSTQLVNLTLIRKEWSWKRMDRLLLSGDTKHCTLKEKIAQFQMCLSLPLCIWIGWIEFLFKQYPEREIALTTDPGIKEYKVIVLGKYQTVPLGYFWRKAPTRFAKPVPALEDF